MSGTKIGGIRAAETNRELHGADFYSKIGTAGGKAPYKGKKGFAANPERARTAGILGGQRSRRGKA